MRTLRTLKTFLFVVLPTTAAVAGAGNLFGPAMHAQQAPAKATGGSCVTYCTTPNACGYVCCFEQCCNGRCIQLDCAPPPPCGGDN